MVMTDYCMIKVRFDNRNDAKKFIDICQEKRLFAYATASEVSGYYLQLDENEERISDYRSDEAAIGGESSDNSPDMLVEVYTSRRLSNVIEDVIEKEFGDSITTYFTVAILDASREMRSRLHKLSLYHAKNNLF